MRYSGYYCVVAITQTKYPSDARSFRFPLDVMTDDGRSEVYTVYYVCVQSMPVALYCESRGLIEILPRYRPLLRDVVLRHTSSYFLYDHLLFGLTINGTFDFGESSSGEFHLCVY